MALTDSQALKVIRNFVEHGGVFNTRLAGDRWQAQAVRGDAAATSQGDTLGEAVESVCDTLSVNVAEIIGKKG